MARSRKPVEIIDPSASLEEAKDLTHPVIPYEFGYADDGESMLERWSAIEKARKSNSRKAKKPTKEIDTGLLSKLSKSGLSTEMIAQIVGCSRDILDNHYRPILERGRVACARRTIAYLEFWAARGKEWPLKILVARHLGWKVEETGTAPTAQCTVAIQTSDGRAFVVSPRTAEVSEYQVGSDSTSSST